MIVHTSIATTSDAASWEQALVDAVDFLTAGQVVALPSETVYGLAADALDRKAVARIFEAKGRPSTNPLIVHVADEGMLETCAASWCSIAALLAKHFWPGPLTLVVPKKPIIPDEVTAGLNSVALRWPSHPLMQAVIQRFQRPLAAPSANLSNRLSPTSAEQVCTQLQGKIPLIVDGGSCSVGIESTVVDLTGSIPTILRPGVIHRGVLSALVPSIQMASGVMDPDEGLAQRSPGQHRQHYAPEASLRVCRWEDEPSLLGRMEYEGLDPAKTCVLCHERFPSSPPFMRVSVIPNDPEAYARALYAELFQCDQLRPQSILVEEPPSKEAWDGVRDRLQRAASGC